MNNRIMQVIWIFVWMVLNPATVSASGDDSLGAPPINTKFNYQGEVIYNGAPANGVFDVRFKLYNAVTGGVELIADDQTITIADGLLNAEIDFGDASFNSQPLWLEILIEQPTIPGFFVLNPRVPINTAPHAIQSIYVANNSIDSSSILNGSVSNVDIGNGQITNAKLANSTLDFEKFADNGAANGDVIQFNGSAWVAAPAAGGTSPWNTNAEGIHYTAGRVGVGTAVPSTKIHLHGDENDELRLSGTNSTPSLHFRRNSNGADWYLKIDPSTNQFFFQSEVDSVEKIMTIKPDGEITRKKQSRTTFVSYKSFIPESNVYTYSTLNFLGITGLHSTYTGGGPAKFHADVSLPVDAVITEVAVIAGDNTPSGAITSKFGYRVFGTSNGVITLSTLTSNNSPFGEVLTDSLNHTVGNNRSYFLDVDVDNVTTAGQEVIFGGVRITYETSIL